jgi:hypothetical protein
MLLRLILGAILTGCALTLGGYVVPTVNTATFSTGIPMSRVIHSILALDTGICYITLLSFITSQKGLVASSRG